MGWGRGGGGLEGEEGVLGGAGGQEGRGGRGGGGGGSRVGERLVWKRWEGGEQLSLPRFDP